MTEYEVYGMTHFTVSKSLLTESLRFFLWCRYAVPVCYQWS